ncbi:hypothetical protein [uncultured Pseudacidovorax sp.]|uniref:hypothetical protein n=1 Tax=uncultured Pseudacidovorax sp. TaxID=679313 RepID=UPI0025F9963C|nr:hypothetical protein [uncultured Pseudacidovorax sp.]
MKTKIASLLLLFSSFSSHAGFACPTPSVTTNAQPSYYLIDAIGFDSSQSSVRLHFYGQDQSTWVTLFNTVGSTSDKGKVSVSIALAAYSTGTPVQISCMNGDVNAIYLVSQPSSNVVLP